LQGHLEVTLVPVGIVAERLRESPLEGGFVEEMPQIVARE
jgi:hypothetical protein